MIRHKPNGKCQMTQPGRTRRSVKPTMFLTGRRCPGYRCAPTRRILNPMCHMILMRHRLSRWSGVMKAAAAMESHTGSWPRSLKPECRAIRRQTSETGEVKMRSRRPARCPGA
jgi:hypothetical protein